MSKTVTIKFLEDYKVFKKGETHTLSAKDVARLLTIGVAEIALSLNQQKNTATMTKMMRKDL